MAYVFKKQNEVPLPIERVEDEHEEEKDYLPSFWWNNRRYHLEEDFMPVRRDIFSEGIPEYITHIEKDKYSDPLYLAFPNKGYVNVYREVARQ